MEDPEYRRTYYAFLFFLYIFLNLQMLSQNNNNSEDEDVIKLRKDHLSHINETLVNGTFNKDSWGLPDGLKKYHNIVFDPKLISNHRYKFYNNVTGSMYGDWYKSKEFRKHLIENGVELGSKGKDILKLDEVPTKPVNYTGDDWSFRKSINASSTGYLTFSPHSLISSNLNKSKPKKVYKLPKSLNFIQGYLHIYSDIAQTEVISLFMEGIYHSTNGSLYLHGYQSAHHYDPKNLLTLLPDNTTYTHVQNYYRDVAKDRLQVYEEVGNDGPLIDTPPNSSACWVQMLLQLEPFSTSTTKSQIQELEQELSLRQGLPTIQPIGLNAYNTFLTSPNCPGLQIISKSRQIGRWKLGILGYKTEILTQKELRYGTLILLVGIIGALLTVYQTNYTSTPSMVTRISWQGIALQTIIDGYICVAHLSLAMLIPKVKLLFVACNFIFFVTLTLFEFRYIQEAIQIQQPESQSYLGRRGGQGFMSLMFYLIMLVGLLVVWETLTSRGIWQQFVLRLSCFLLYSFFIPQIIRNVKRNTNSALAWRYLIGISTVKLIIPVYLFAYPYSLLNLPPTAQLVDLFGYPVSWVVFLVAYVYLQALVLMSQDLLGPRWFLPNFIFTPAYDYFKVPVTDDVEAQIPTSNSQDCAICMLPLTSSNPNTSNSNSHLPSNLDSKDSTTTEPLLSSSNAAAASPSASLVHGPVSVAKAALKRISKDKLVMTTPCAHKFHTNCLEQLECPVCRNALPPI